MANDEVRMSDDVAVELTHGPVDNIGIHGYGTVEVFGPEGDLKQTVEFTNLVTDVGDLYYAMKAIAGVSPAAPAGPTNATGLQIGSGTTAASKAGAGAAMVTLLAGAALDTGYPQTQNLGAGLGVNGVYKTTFAAGTGTGTTNEVVLTNGAVGTASVAANTIHRVVLGTGVVKGALDSLAVTLNAKFLG